MRVRMKISKSELYKWNKVLETPNEPKSDSVTAQNVKNGNKLFRSSFLMADYTLCEQWILFSRKKIYNYTNHLTDAETHCHYTSKFTNKFLVRICQASRILNIQKFVSYGVEWQDWQKLIYSTHRVCNHWLMGIGHNEHYTRQ